MKKALSLFVIFLSCILLYGCSYHPRNSVPYPPPRPNFSYPIEEVEVVIPPYPGDFMEASRVQVTQKACIVIDAGHGDEDFGTRSSSDPKYHEKSLNLTTALILNDFLQKMGYKTEMTRTKDEFIPLQGRADFANQRNADLFVSVHYNSAPTKKAEGVEVFYYKSEDNKPRSNASRKLAASILTQVIQITKAKSRGVKHGNFAVIRETTMPAILVEAGFLTNDEEMEKIKDPAYVKSIAWGIAQGIQRYLADQP